MTQGCPRRDSNPQNLRSKRNTYTNSVTWANILLRTKFVLYSSNEFKTTHYYTAFGVGDRIRTCIRLDLQTSTSPFGHTHMRWDFCSFYWSNPTKTPKLATKSGLEPPSVTDYKSGTSLFPARAVTLPIRLHGV